MRHFFEEMIYDFISVDFFSGWTLMHVNCLRFPFRGSYASDRFKIFSNSIGNKTNCLFFSKFSFQPQITSSHKIHHIQTINNTKNTKIHPLNSNA